MKRWIKNRIYTLYCVVRKTFIFQRLLIAFLVVILIPAMIMLGFLYQNVEEEFYQTGIHYVRQNLESTRKTVYNTYREYELRMEGCLKEDELLEALQSPDMEGKRDAVSEFLKTKKETIICENLFVITPDEVYSAYNSDKTPQTLLVDEQGFRSSRVYRESLTLQQKINWFNTVRENNIYYTNSRKSSYLGSYVTLTGRIVSEKEVLGLLVANIDTARLSGISEFDSVYNQDKYLIDKDGIITYLNNDYLYKDYPKDIWKKAIENEGRVVSCRVQGEDNLFLAQSLGKSDWYVVNVVLEKRLLAGFYDLRNLQFIMLAVSILLSLVVCIFVTVSIAFPLNRIKKQMISYGRKDLTMQIDDVGNDEITEVSRHFQRMGKQIQELFEKKIQAELCMEKEKMKQKEMEIEALQMQINPHFLYNTLDLIRWNVVRLENGNDRVSRMIGNYSSMMRYNIRLGEGYAAIEEELQYVQKYISLLNMLYETKIKLEIIRNDIDVSNIMIGKLFFQPMIENAVLHGKLNKLHEPIIRIILEQKESLCISIMNNGEDIPLEDMERLNREFSSTETESLRVGLYNVNQRMRLLFGETSCLSVREREGMVCFTLMLPRNGKED